MEIPGFAYGKYILRYGANVEEFQLYQHFVFGS